MVLFLCEHIRQRMIVLALLCTNRSHHRLFRCFVEVLGGLNAHVHCAEALSILHISARAIPSLRAVCWEPGASQRGRFTERVQAVCTVRAEQI